jgi:hypothetical protein
MKALEEVYKTILILLDPTRGEPRISLALEYHVLEPFTLVFLGKILYAACLL